MALLKRLLVSVLLLIALAHPIAANDIVVHGYTASHSIDATIDGQEMTVPDDMANRHRAMIHDQWEFDAQGNRIRTIPAYRTPAPSTDPKDYVLTRVQFMAMLDIASLLPTVDAVIGGITDPVERAVARSRFNNEQAFDRDDPLLVQLSGDAGLTSGQVDAYWMQAKDLPL